MWSMLCACLLPPPPPHGVPQVLAKQDPATTLTKTLSFSSATTPLIFQTTIEGCVEKRQGRTFGPPGNKSMIVFVDDISMPEVNNWGDQITLEIVRQLVEYAGMYNLQKPGEWKSIVDLHFIGCMLHPGGGKNDIPNRAKRHFHAMNVTLPSAASIFQIFGSMTAMAFSSSVVPEAVSVAANKKLVQMTLDVWQVLGGVQWGSVGISGNQWESVGISGTPWDSVGLRGGHWRSVAISGDQW